MKGAGRTVWGFACLYAAGEEFEIGESAAQNLDATV
jgi:hypothetical protein